MIQPQGAAQRLARLLGRPRRTTPRGVHDERSLTRQAFQRHPRVFADRLEQLDFAVEAAHGEGHVLEFGVFEGRSIRRLASACPDFTVWGFDSFEGLPEIWQRSRAGESYAPGHFAVSALPAVPANVRLVKGFFDASLEPWLAAHPGPVRLLHLDADLYSSTRTVLTLLNERIRPGSVLVFDELCDWRDSGVYDLWPEGEWRALLEWLGAHGRRIRILARAKQWAAVVQVVR